jgi:hypothetical protein
MTIHWKALEEHFLMLPLVFDSTILGENSFKKNLSPQRIKAMLLHTKIND